MLLFVGCALIASSLFALARWRSRWIIPIAVLGSAAGIVIIVTTSRVRPEGSSSDDTDYVCGAVGETMLQNAFDYVMSTPHPPTDAPAEFRGRHALMVRLFRSVARFCVRTPESCVRILESADPTSGEFWWRVHYVSGKMFNREACEEPLSRAPAEYRWGHLPETGSTTPP